ncbi:MAG TPA: SMP-30/gluconolactonase/LRE family protein [Cellulomonas sp.]
MTGRTPVIDLAAVGAPARTLDLRAVPRAEADWRVAGAQRAVLGEHPLHDPVTGDLLWVDVDGCLVHGWGGRTRRAPTPVGLVWPTASGGLLVATAAGLGVLPAGARAAVPPSGRPDLPHPLGAEDLGPLLRPPDMPVGFRFNDGGTDPGGRLWIASTAADASDGTLYRLDVLPGRAPRLTPVVRGVRCGNGVAWSPDGETMYLTDSTTRRVHRLAYDVATGTVAEPEVLLALAGHGPMPDGTAVDAQGGLWIALWGAGAVLRLAADGEPVEARTLPTPLVTCPGFGPVGSGDLYVSTAGAPAPGTEPSPGDPCAGALLRVAVDVDGLVPRAVRGL